ncbi:MAG: hypothetical protein EP297_01115 [Gammaproteobacteria bacterium]|nr:MAG: hypothetical protein EP297_01115 [Gammaproteobacteria bacterium]
MEHVSYIADLVSVTIALLFIAALALLASRLIKLPFTVMLVVIGVVINGLAAELRMAHTGCRK